jgi:hypothetical protein
MSFLPLEDKGWKIYCFSVCPRKQSHKPSFPEWGVKLSVCQKKNEKCLLFPEDWGMMYVPEGNLLPWN